MVESKPSTLMAGQLIEHVTAAGTVSPMIEERITREDWLFYSDLFGPWRTYADRVHTLLEIARNPIRAEVA